MSTPDGWEERVRSKLNESEQLEDVVEVVRELCIRSRAEASEDGYALHIGAFGSLKDLTLADPVRGGQLIVELLLPFCAQQVPENVRGARLAVTRCREILRDWIEQYGNDAAPIRNRVLDSLVAHLDRREVIERCWTISTIGFRRHDVVQALLGVVRRADDERGDTALSVITNLGVGSDERAGVLEECHRRAQKRFNLPLIGALRRLADPTSSDIVCNVWLRAIDTEGWGFDHSLALRILADIADARSSDAALQDEMFERLESLLETSRKEVFLSSLGTRCDTPRVVRALLYEAERETDDTPLAAHRRYLLGNRLTECTRPRQLEGLREEGSEAVFRALELDAVRDTKAKGRWTTEAGAHKEMAWHNLLRVRHGAILDKFDEAVGHETNGFVREDILRLLACFRFEQLPELALQWVAERYNAGDGDDSEVAARLAAIGFVSGSPSRTAFEALRSFGFTFKGHVLTESVDGLAEVATALVRYGDESVVGDLLFTAESAGEPHQRSCAAATLFHLPIEILSHETYQRSISRLLLSSDDDTVKRHLLRVLLPASVGARDGTPSETLREWAFQRGDEVGWNAMDALARAGALDNDSVMLTRLGLQPVGSTWELLPTRKKYSAWECWTIGRLYARHPDTFSSAISSIIQTQEWPAVYQVLSRLTVAHGEPGDRPVPENIRQALIKRIEERQTHGFGETGIFGGLAFVVPELLASYAWEKLWLNWIPESRLALADALGRAKYRGPGAKAAAVLKLQQLGGDSHYTVRRSAFRSLGYLSPDSLLESCASWSSENAPSDLRMRAAEAAAWLDHESHREALTELIAQLRIDADRVVREAAQRSWQECRARGWRRIYLRKVQDALGGSNDEILSAWGYAEALMRIGDDECVRSIGELLGNPALRPNVRHWLKMIQKETQTNWEKTTREWPEPSLPWEGTVEEVRGEIVLRDQRSVSVQLWLWSAAAPVPGQASRWGGPLVPKVAALAASWPR